MSVPTARSRAIRPAASRRSRIGTLAAAAAALLLGGCASLYTPVNQELRVRAVQNDANVEAVCDVGNDRGRWTVATPTTIAVTRSSQPLTAECRTPEGSANLRVYQAERETALGLGSRAAYAYPGKVVVPLPIDAIGPRNRLTVRAAPFAAIDDVASVPNIDDGGRAGYRRFLQGPLPRAFAVSESGRWIRVNGARGADRVALARCEGEGGHCRLYAVDDQVVWDRKRTPELVAIR